MRSILFLTSILMSVFIFTSSPSNAQTETPMRVGFVSVYNYVEIPFADSETENHAIEFAQELLMETHKEVLEILAMRSDIVLVNTDSLHNLPAYKRLKDELRIFNHVTPAYGYLYLSANTNKNWQVVMDELPGLDALAIMDVRYFLTDADENTVMGTSRVTGVCNFSIISPKRNVHLETYVSEKTKQRVKVRKRNIVDLIELESLMKELSIQITNQIPGKIMDERLKR